MIRQSLLGLYLWGNGKLCDLYIGKALQSNSHGLIHLFTNHVFPKSRSKMLNSPRDNNSIGL